MKLLLFLLCSCLALVAQQQVNVTLSFNAEEVKFARFAWEQNNLTRSSNGQPPLSFPDYAQPLADAASRQIVQQGQQLARREVTRHLARVNFDTLTNTAAILKTNVVETP